MAGIREVDLTPALAEELAALKAGSDCTAPHEFVFGSTHHKRRDRSTAAPLDRHRIRERILKPATQAANVKLARQRIDPIEDPALHGLRRTYASLRFALGDDPVYVAQQLGPHGALVLDEGVRPRREAAGAALGTHPRGL